MTTMGNITALQAMLIHLADEEVGFTFDVISTNSSLL